MTRLIAALVFMFTAIAAQAEEVTTYTLDNGMEVVVIEDNRAPVVVHMLWYKVGSADEPEGASGVAHFLEHLMFKGTDILEPGEFSEVVAANGGSDNAFTSYDYTAYFQRVAADRLELMMQMESNRMNNLVINPAEVEPERQVVIEERNQRTENNPNALAGEQFRAAQFQNHRYGIPIIGWRHEIDDLSIADLQNFYDLYYSPNNAVLVVAGDVDPDEVLELARTYYGVIPSEPQLPERLRPEEPPQRAERRITYVDPRVSQPYLIRSYLAPERDADAQEEAAALVYLAELLGGSSFTSDLGQALQFDTQTAVYTNASYGGSSLDDTTFSFVVVPTDGVALSEAEAAMDEVIANFMNAEIDAARMDSLRTQLRASEVYALDDTAGLARRYGAALTQGLTVADVQAWPDILQAVTVDDIKSVAEKVLNREQAVTGWVVANQEEAR
ncbi:pitrilysin family protein [Cognatiyoonia sp. IB215182]|uniref:M16 family metallopeptidase n=1 Tax=Cognatiyoonia sp. IB215182 TaxID=3097353 RepID=UPI002A1131DA|nr:pitrilysin family protein [Cognatiyoonia sp. IB215182]MDX8354562.1 pitrilysin family protein [Cognatiyoonia sp. IB215182]